MEISSSVRLPKKYAQTTGLPVAMPSTNRTKSPLSLFTLLRYLLRKLLNTTNTQTCRKSLPLVPIATLTPSNDLPPPAAIEKVYPPSILQAGSVLSSSRVAVQIRTPSTMIRRSILTLSSCDYPKCFRPQPHLFLQKRSTPM